MKYDEVSKLYRLRNGLLERLYNGSAGRGRKHIYGWAVFEGTPAGRHGYIGVKIGNVWTSKHRVIACLKYARDLADGELVDHKDNDQSNNHPDNLHIVTAQVNRTKDFKYKLPKLYKGRYRATVSITKSHKRSLQIALGSYDNAAHHKAITLAVKSVFVLRSCNPLRTQFRDLVGAGQYGYAREIVQEYARDLPYCTLR